MSRKDKQLAIRYDYARGRKWASAARKSARTISDWARVVLDEAAQLEWTPDAPEATRRREADRLLIECFDDLAEVNPQAARWLISLAEAAAERPEAAEAVAMLAEGALAALRAPGGIARTHRGPHAQASDRANGSEG